MTYNDLQTQAAQRHLSILGGFHPEDDPHLPDKCETLIMLGPKEPEFWPAFQTSPEWLDGRADPMDRWSVRVIGTWAREVQATALFPFGGPPYLPFFSWAIETGRVHQSPIMLLVHDTAGLFVSFRGALALRERVDLPEAPASPCLACPDQPCRTACPVEAFDGSGYDVPNCKNYLSTDAGTECMTQGCAARRICPVSAAYQRLPEQSAFHMKAFKG